MNKRGDIPAGIFFIVGMFALTIIFIVGNLILNEFNDEFAESDVISQQGKDMISSIQGRYVAILDSAFLMAFVGVFIAIVIGAFFIRMHPAIFYISIPILAMLIFLAAIYGNVFQAIISNDVLAGSAADFTILTFIMGNYVYFITGVILIVSVALFSRNRAGQSP